MGANLQKPASNMNVGGTAFIPGQAVNATAFVPKTAAAPVNAFNPGSMTTQASPFTASTAPKPATQAFSKPQVAAP